MPFEAFLGYCLSWSLGLLLPGTQTSDPALIHIWGCSSHCDGVPQHHSLPLGSRRSQDKSVYWTGICPEVLLWEVWWVLAWHSCEVAVPQCSLSADSPDSSPQNTSGNDEVFFSVGLLCWCLQFKYKDFSTIIRDLQLYLENGLEQIPFSSPSNTELYMGKTVISMENKEQTEAILLTPNVSFLSPEIAHIFVSKSIEKG